MHKNIDRNVIVLAIKPHYANAIMCGKKKVEFRRNGTPVNIKYIVFYSTSPDKKIIGYCEVIKCDVSSPQILWKKYGVHGGILRKEFFKYYAGINNGKCYIIRKPRKFTRPILQKDFWSISTVPQSFAYLNKDEWKRLKRKKINN